MLILRREHHSPAIWQVLHKTWATLIMLNTSSWIFKKSFLWGLIRGALEMIFKNSSPYAQVSNILFCKERQNWKPIYSGYPDAPLFNQEKSKLMQTKGQLSKDQSCFFVCTTFDSFLNDLSLTLLYSFNLLNAITFLKIFGWKVRKGVAGKASAGEVYLPLWWLEQIENLRKSSAVRRTPPAGRNAPLPEVVYNCALSKNSDRAHYPR